MDRVKEGERAWEMEKAKRKRMDEGATIKAKTGRRQREEKRRMQGKITNMKMLCMFRMIASITTKTIRNSAAEWSE